MLRYLYASELEAHPILADSMFRDRAAQFRDRLGWAVTVDAAGHERDAYDGRDPLYVIWQRPDGRHGGSLRFLPTEGPTMLADHFADLVPGQDLAGPDVWECTRFCLAPDADRRMSARLMLGAHDLGTGLGLRHAVGVFDARMVRIYRALGWEPEVFGQRGAGAVAISAGRWAFDAALRPVLLARSGLSAALADLWFARAFGGAAGLARAG